MKIMIVDDHREMRRLVRSTLSHMADEFVECDNGSEAVRHSRESVRTGRSWILP